MLEYLVSKTIDVTNLAEQLFSYSEIKNVLFSDMKIVVVHETLNQTQIDEVNGIVAAYIAKQNVSDVIHGAINFGQEMLVDFASDNVLMGITQAGKTKEVADYLADLTRYLQTGSLYEVINEIDRLQNAGLPVELEPFITSEKLLAFKNKIQTYLGIA